MSAEKPKNEGTNEAKEGKKDNGLLNVLNFGERKERLAAKQTALREEEAATKEEEEKRVAELGKEIEKTGKSAEDSEEDAEPNDKDKEEAMQKKRELLNNTLHKVSYGLAVDLEKNYPKGKKEPNVFEKMAWEGRAILLKLLIMVGGTPEWTEILNSTQKEFMEKKMGMQIIEEKNEKGETVPAIKWIDPVEGWEPIPAGMDDVFTQVYGESGKQEVYKKINAETTMADLIAMAPDSDESDQAVNTRKLIKALEDSGLEPDDKENKIQAYLGKNARKVMDLLENDTEPSEPATPTEPTEPSEPTEPTTPPAS